MTFNVYNTTRYPSEPNEYFLIDMINRIVMDTFEETHSKNTLEVALLGGPPREDEEFMEVVNALESCAYTPKELNHFEH